MPRLPAAALLCLALAACSAQDTPRPATLVAATPAQVDLGALRRVQDGEELPATGQLSAVASDLSGRRQPIALREAVTDAYTDYVGTVRISEHDQLNFQVDVPGADCAGTARLARTF